MLLVISLAVSLFIGCIPVIPDEDEEEGEGKIAFESHRDGNEEIYLMNADGSKQTRLTNNNFHPDWEPKYCLPSWGP